MIIKTHDFIVEEMEDDEIINVEHFETLAEARKFVYMEQGTFDISRVRYVAKGPDRDHLDEVSRDYEHIETIGSRA